MKVNRIVLLAFCAAVFSSSAFAGLAEELCKDWAASEAVDPWDLEDYVRNCAEEIESTGAFSEESSYEESTNSEVADEPVAQPVN